MNSDNVSKAALSLKGIAELYPHFWATSYQHGRLFRVDAPPAPDTVTIHVTDDCPMNCEFCFASRSQRAPALTPDEFQSIIEVFRGVSRIVILGGEPLSWPHLAPSLSRASISASSFEIFTSGFPLLNAGGDPFLYLRGVVSPEAVERGTTLVFSVDAWHRDRLGASSARDVVDLALNLRRGGSVGVKFNVTDRAFFPAGYINFSVARDILHEYHPGLRELFDSLFQRQAVEEAFLFNPVIAHGTQTDEARPLNASDLLLHPEVVVGRRDDNRIAVMTHLTALWMNPTPDYLVAAHIGDPDFVSSLLQSLLSQQLGLNQFPFLTDVVSWLCFSDDSYAISSLDQLKPFSGDPLCDSMIDALDARDRRKVLDCARVLPLWLLLRDWPRSQPILADQIAARLAAITPSQFPIRLTEHPAHNALPWRPVRDLLTNYFSSRPETLHRAIDALAAFAQEHFSLGRAPRQDGTASRMGRFIDELPQGAPLSATRLIMPGDVVPDAGPAFPVAPSILFSENGVEFDFFFLRYDPEPCEKPFLDAWALWFSYLRRILDDREWALLTDRLSTAEIDSRLAHIAQSAPPPAEPADSRPDAQIIFRNLFLDARANALPYDNSELARAVLETDLPQFEPDSLQKLREEFRYWQSSGMKPL